MVLGEKWQEILALSTLFLACLIGISLLTHTPADPPASTAPVIENAAGRAGAYLSYGLFVLIGDLSWVMVILLGLVAVRGFMHTLESISGRGLLGWSLVLIGSAGSLSFLDRLGWSLDGGMVGLYLMDRVHPFLGQAGSLLLFAFCLLLGLNVQTARTIKRTLIEAGELGVDLWYGLRAGIERLVGLVGSLRNWLGSAGSTPEPSIRSSSSGSTAAPDVSPDAGSGDAGGPAEDGDEEDGEEDRQNVIDFEAHRSDGENEADDEDGTSSPGEADGPKHGDPVEVDEERPEVDEADLSRYRLPPIDILEPGNIQGATPDEESLRETSKKLESTFEEFGIDASVVAVNPGPVLTMYEVEPGPGVSVKKFESRAEDIKLNLAVESVRIVSPIPGKSALGVEVPNSNRALVKLRDVLTTDAYRDDDRALPLALGLDVLGDPMVIDLAQLPHLLVAGATGSGKSVCLNGMICSLLCRLPPDELKLVLVDPKRVELKLYDGLPHLMTPVIDDPSEANKVLKWAVREMENRYEKLSEAGVRDIRAYNRRLEEGEISGDKMPYLVIIVDELADLMFTNPKECEQSITRLAQMARAVGIHMCLATQRPSTDVITGLIKANLPARLAFRVSSGTDSRVILDQNGAETLLGDGDLLFLSAEAPHPRRGQGAFLEAGETEDLIRFVKQQLRPSYVNKDDLFDRSPAGDFSETMEDEYYDDAKELVIQRGKASASMIQRRFRVGYNRAARMVDAMEEEGIVGPHRGSKARNVIVDPAEYFDEDEMEEEE